MKHEKVIKIGFLTDDVLEEKGTPFVSITEKLYLTKVREDEDGNTFSRYDEEYHAFLHLNEKSQPVFHVSFIHRTHGYDVEDNDFQIMVEAHRPEWATFYRAEYDFSAPSGWCFVDHFEEGDGDVTLEKLQRCLFHVLEDCFLLTGGHAFLPFLERI